MKHKPLIALFLIILFAAIGAQMVFSHRGFTDWMTIPEMKTFLKPADTQTPEEAKIWDHRWATEIQNRWSDGAAEFRIRIGDAPKTGLYLWSWGLNLDRVHMDALLEDMGNKGFRLVSLSTFKWPDGSERFSGIWHKTDKP